MIKLTCTMHYEETDYLGGVPVRNTPFPHFDYLFLCASSTVHMMKLVLVGF